jgi:hypothetical protein
MDYKQKGWKGVDRIHVAQERTNGRLVYIYGNEVSTTIKHNEFIDHLKKCLLLKKGYNAQS